MMRHPACFAFLGVILLLAAAAKAPAADDRPGERADGVLPVDASGRPLNFDFETGTLKDWTAEGEAFARQPVEGDTVAARRSDMKSRHAGRFWIGSYERAGDAPQGTLTSVPFKVTKPYASFLIGGGSHRDTYVELVQPETSEVIYRAAGDESEDMKPVAVDLRRQLGNTIVIRLVDRDSNGWGHVNFDDFRLHDAAPAIPARPAPSSADVYANAGLSPTDAAKAMTVPEGFKVTLFAGEPDVVQPIAIALDDRGRVWVAEAYSYPHRVPAEQAKDRILIFEDKDGDGHFDSRKVFADKLNLVSGLELGFGGVWVGAAPEFLFIPDKDGDDRPDGPPQVMLDGWGQHDTHETLNSFTWGPDGWLYGCHGVFTHSLVGKPGAPDSQRSPINGGIWRYHPTKHRFEVYAHGTSNPWGFDFDDHGQSFLTSCVIPHLYQVIPGGRYERQAGQHFNPYTYDDIKTIADHRHYVGANPHAANGRSDSAGGGHAHAGAMIYLGGAWPKEYRGSIFMNNIHGARLNRDTLSPKGSGYVGSHAPDFLMANDSWSQIVNLQYGPDGSMFMIDWYDKNQCHRTENEVHDRTNGRIFKVAYSRAKPAAAHENLKSLDDRALVDLLLHPNDWYVRHARRILQERGAKPETRAALARVAFSHLDPTRRLRALWALHSSGGLGEEHVAQGLANDDPYVRAWTVRLASEGKEPSSATLAKFAELAKADPSPVVRLDIAAALQRLPLDARWDIVAALVGHGEDAGDQNLPLMDWYAAEPLAAADPVRASRLAASAQIPLIATFMTRRIAALGTPEALALLVDQLGHAQSPAQRHELLDGINGALKGRRDIAMPAGWAAIAAKLMADKDGGIRIQAANLGVSFGDPKALEMMRGTVGDRTADPTMRAQALAALLRARDAKLPATLRGLLADAELRGQAIRGLAQFDDKNTPDDLLKVYAQLTPGEKRDALNTLASRPGFARALLDAVSRKQVPATDLSADLVRQLRNLKDSGIDEQIAKVWGTVRQSSQDKSALIDRYRALIRRPYAPRGDVNLGRAIFAKTCGQCHTLFGTGGKVGPELTGSNRADLEYVLRNVLDPNELIGKDYLAHVLALGDGRVLTGIIRAEDKDTVTLVTANETLTVPVADIDERKPSDKSMMPDDLLTPLKEDEIRSLVAYLASPNQVPAFATVENVQSFFNGRDLTGWQGDPKLWSVEDGQIVGKTSGLARNEFLRSDLMAGDFRLTVQVKLVANRGNSGIQFRSEALPDGEMKGDQADIGEGWWGKLYEENGRGLLWKESGESHLKPGDWNSYEIVAAGSRIRTYLNGHLCVDLDDPAGARRGIFALQLHSGGPTEVRYKDLKLELKAAPETTAR